MMAVVFHKGWAITASLLLPRSRQTDSLQNCFLKEDMFREIMAHLLMETDVDVYLILRSPVHCLRQTSAGGGGCGVFGGWGWCSSLEKQLLCGAGGLDYIRHKLCGCRCWKWQISLIAWWTRWRSVDKHKLLSALEMQENVCGSTTN